MRSMRCLLYTSLFFHKPIFNFLSIFLGLSAIALSYNGTIKRKCIFVFYILAVSCLIAVSYTHLDVYKRQLYR